MPLFRKFANAVLNRFYLIALAAAALFLLESVLLVLWAFFPQDTVFGAIAAVVAVWLGAVGGIGVWLVYQKIVRPQLAIENFAGALARGEFPPLLKGAGSRNEAFPELTRSLNLLRDRLQNQNARLQTLRQYEQQLQQHDKDESGELRSRILTNLAPDLRIPLNALSGYEFLLKTDPGSPHREEFFRAIGRNVISAERTIERMVDIGQLATPIEGETDRGSFDTGSFMQQLANYNAPALAEQEVKLALHFAANAPEELSLDRELLFQLLTILIRVAEHIVARGEQLELSCSSENDTVVFTIRTASASEPHRELAELFNTQRNGSADLLKETELTLLGLLFVESQAHLLGAELLVSGFGEHGAELKLVLPENVAASHLRRTGSIGTIHFAGTSTNPDGLHLGRHPGPGTPKRLLLIDNDRDFGIILQYMFPETEVEIYPTLDRLPKSVALKNFDAAILAIVPRWGRNYSEATLDFLAATVQADLPVIAMLTDRSERLRRKLSRAGAGRIMTKPVNYQELKNYLTGKKETSPPS